MGGAASGAPARTLRAEAVKAIRHAFPELLKRPATRIARVDALNALDKLVRDGKPTMAGRTLAYARAAFRWAEKRGKVPNNPFQGLPLAASTTACERLLNDASLRKCGLPRTSSVTRSARSASSRC